jgi:hypothetical protein
MELQHALAQIADIRQQMSRARQFRGFRAATALFTAFAAGAAGAWQAWEMGDLTTHPISFVTFWVCIAVACLAVCTVEVAWRYRKADSSLEQELTPQAVGQFLPFVFVGALLTFTLCKFAAAELWMLPGLWQILFGLGLFSTRRMFPTPILYVGIFYTLCGLANLNEIAPHFSAWSMAIPFGIGQSAAAAILYWYLEREHAA